MGSKMGTSTGSSSSTTPNISDDDSGQDKDGDANQEEAGENSDHITAKGARAGNCDTQGDSAIYTSNATAKVPATTDVSDSVAVAVPSTIMKITTMTATLPTTNEDDSGADSGIDSNRPGLDDDYIIITNMPSATAAVTAILAMPAAAKAAATLTTAITMATATTPAPSDTATAVDGCQDHIFTS